ncbi:hypothetical protein LTR50_002739 [Elasticomyces elasticus]|nr:hypothetical protein LTR50_002739 [Elasticomyces elasticus]
MLNDHSPRWVEINGVLWPSQAHWWACTGKTFRLLDLPGEIRTSIYRYALGPAAEPGILPELRRRGARDRGQRPRPTFTLLSASKQIYTEASYEFFTYTPFAFTILKLAKRFFAGKWAFEKIRVLEFSLSHEGFLQLFCCHLNSKHSFRNHGRRTINRIRQMNLKRLTLCMPPPRDMVLADFLDEGCHKTVVDWIMAAAYRELGGLPIRFTGYLKESQRTATVKFEEARKLRQRWLTMRESLGLPAVGDWELEHDDEDGGVKLDECAQDECAKSEDNGTEVNNRDADLPPRCFCETPCHGVWVENDLN